MRKAVLDAYVDIVTEEEALHGLLVAPGEHVPFIGAGVSAEAGIPLAWQICDDIREILGRAYDGGLDDDRARRELNWDDVARRYGTCLERYGPPEDRVNYFRTLLRGRRPAFAHDALTLLMAHDKLSRNAMTTNFDKLVEQSFIAQNIRECQPIRMAEEAEFWGPEPDKCYLMKLHGDYDTHNILNTRAETRSIPDFFVDRAQELLIGRGLFALGSAGNEESILAFVKALLSTPERRFLSRGVRWGVYVGNSKPEGLTDEQSAGLVIGALERGAVNRPLVELLSDLNQSSKPCSFFPVWGSGRFLHLLIRNLGDPALIDAARLLLDHDMRVAALYRDKGLTQPAVQKHLARLRKEQERLRQRQPAPYAPTRPVAAFDFPAGGVTGRVVYGDITSPNLLRDAAAGAGLRAVVSADDTVISAGGGVALALLDRAGSRFVLNELAKLSPIPHGTAAVTSAGDLPVAYVLHAAALDLDTEGNSVVTPDSVRSAIRDALAKAAALEVGVVFTPLLGAGTAGLSASDSLRAILEVAGEPRSAATPMHLQVVIYDETDLSRADAEQLVADAAG